MAEEAPAEEEAPTEHKVSGREEAAPEGEEVPAEREAPNDQGGKAGGDSEETHVANKSQLAGENAVGGDAAPEETAPEEEGHVEEVAPPAEEVSVQEEGDAVPAAVDAMDLSLLNPVADLERTKAIVAKLDEDSNGEISLVEVKVLFSKLLDIPAEDIPDDHEEVRSILVGLSACVAFTLFNPFQPKVIEFAGMSAEDMVQKLQSEIPKVKIDEYYVALGLGADGASAEARSKTYQLVKAHKISAFSQCSLSFSLSSPITSQLPPRQELKNAHAPVGDR